MSQLNPFVAAILPSAQVQQQTSAERAGTIRRAQELQKNAARAKGGDTFEHQVESTDAVAEVKDEDRPRDQRGSHSRPARQENADENASDETPRLDITG